MVVKWAQLNAICRTKLPTNTAGIACRQSNLKKKKQKKKSRKGKTIQQLLKSTLVIWAFEWLRGSLNFKLPSASPLIFFTMYHIGQRRALSVLINYVKQCSMIKSACFTNLIFPFPWFYNIHNFLTAEVNTHCSPQHDFFLFWQTRPHVLWVQCKDMYSWALQLWFQPTDFVSCLPLPIFAVTVPHAVYC